MNRPRSEDGIIDNTKRQPPIPLREGGKFYWIWPDGVKQEADALSFVNHAHDCGNCVKGFVVWYSMRS